MLNVVSGRSCNLRDDRDDPFCQDTLEGRTTGTEGVCEPRPLQFPGFTSLHPGKVCLAQVKTTWSLTKIVLGSLFCFLL